MVKAASEGLGLKAMKEDYTQPLGPWMFVDATAAIGVSQMRPRETSILGDAKPLPPGGGPGPEDQLVEGPQPRHPADLMTKQVDHVTQIRLLGLGGTRQEREEPRQRRRLEFARSRFAQWTRAR